MAYPTRRRGIFNPNICIIRTRFWPTQWFYFYTTRTKKQQLTPLTAAVGSTLQLSCLKLGLAPLLGGSGSIVPGPGSVPPSLLS
jgi:hypothetical protein